MAIPEKPLEIKLDADEMTLDELELFAGETYNALGFKKFLHEHANWTRAEIGNIKRKELNVVYNQTAKKVNAFFVPLSDEPR